MSNLLIQHTSDGSQTLFSETFKETYHSVNGAVTESLHVFINAGFSACLKNPIRIFEVGFGTGLNALLTLVEAQKRAVAIDYQSIELFPVDKKTLDNLDYSHILGIDAHLFNALHNTPWNSKTEILQGFQLTKIKEDLVKYEFSEINDLVYFDAFSPVIQPELWGEDIFKRIYEHMPDGGILTTYCAKGAVRRTLQKVGFATERLPGPPGKREMLRATKNL